MATQFRSDICIAGAGAAGITLALELAKSGVSIILAEAGGMEFEELSQSNYNGSLSGSKYQDLHTSRLRYLGGSTNHWAGNCSRLDDIDFEKRNWLPYSGWPFNGQSIAQFYDRGATYIELPRADGASEAWTPPLIGRKLNLDKTTFSDGISLQSPPTRFGERYLDVMESSDHLQLFVNATLCDIELHEDLSAVKYVEFRSGNSCHFFVYAKCYVLSMGGIENPRMLLNVTKQISNGIGNYNGLVGRFFMDHPVIEGAAFLPSRPLDLSLQDPGTRTGAFVKLTENALHQKQMLNVRMPFISASRAYLSEGVEAVHQLSEHISKFDFDLKLFRHMWEVITDIDTVADAFARRTMGIPLLENADSFGGYLLDTMIEARPDPNNRVSLINDLDGFGLRRVKLHWQLAQQDIENLKRAYEILGRELGRLGSGRLMLRFDDDSAGRLFDELLSFGSHHMGTTRASNDPRLGVVDGNCRVHGLSNLFVAGSSVFPTGGCVPPTWTIVALAIRLGDHLKRLLPEL